MTSGVKRCTTAVGLVAGCMSVLLSACAADEERPQPLPPSGGVINEVSCDMLSEQAPEPGDTGQFWLNGGAAQCVAQGQYCPAMWLETWCDGGLAFVVCEGQTWRATCSAAGEAGADGSGD